MQIATRAATALTFGLGAKSRRQARLAPPPADLPAPDSRPVAPLPVRLLAGTPAAMPTGTCLPQLAVAVADHERWFGDGRMIRPVAAATVAARDRFRVFALHTIPVGEDGADVPVHVGQRLPPSRKRDEFGDLADGGLHKGTTGCGFKDRQGLGAAIAAIGWQDGRQVCLIGGTAALRCQERDSVIILQATVIAVWLRRSAGLGRLYANLDHADFDE